MKKSCAHAWAMVGAALILSACGGGGGDSGGTSNPPAPSPPPAPQEELLLAGWAQSGMSQALLVIDPDQPSRPVFSGLVDSLLEASPFVFDSNARRVTLGRGSQVFYTSAGRLHQISLRKSQSTPGQRISSLTTACTVDDWHPFSYSTGDDGWVEVTEAGPDADCALIADNRKAFVRNSAAATTDATMLPSGVRVVSSLPDTASNTLTGFVAYDGRTAPAKFTLYSPSLTYVADVSGGAGGTSMEFMSFVPGGQLTSSAYVRIGSALRRLDWSATTATLSTPRHLFTSPATEDAVSLSDNTAMFFTDGLTVRRIDASGNTSLLATLDAAGGTEVGLRGLTSGHVLVEQSPADRFAPEVHAIPRQGGVPQRLAPAAGPKYVIGTRNDDIVYSTYPAYGSRALRRVRADGSGDQLIAPLNSGYPMPVYETTFPYLAGAYLSAVMWCDIPTSGHCVNGTIRSYDLQSGAVTALGTTPPAGPGHISLYVNGSGYSGRPTMIAATALHTTASGFMTDFYLVRPGVANSLLRLTHNIP